MPCSYPTVPVQLLTRGRFALGSGAVNVAADGDDVIVSLRQNGGELAQYRLSPDDAERLASRILRAAMTAEPHAETYV